MDWFQSHLLSIQVLFEILFSVLCGVELELVSEAKDSGMAKG